MKAINNSNSKYKINKLLLIALGILFVTAFTFNTAGAFKQYQKNIISKKKTQIYKVDVQIVNTDTLQAIENSKSRWRYWMEYEIENKKAIIIFSMDINNRMRYYYSKDTLNHQIILFPQKVEGAMQGTDTLNYLLKPNGQLEIKGDLNGKSNTILLHSFSIDSFPLLQRKPHFFPTE